MSLLGVPTCWSMTSFKITLVVLQVHLRWHVRFADTAYSLKFREVLMCCKKKTNCISFLAETGKFLLVFFLPFFFYFSFFGFIWCCIYWSKSESMFWIIPKSLFPHPLSYDNGEIIFFLCRMGVSDLFISKRKTKARGWAPWELEWKELIFSGHETYIDL